MSRRGIRTTNPVNVTVVGGGGGGPETPGLVYTETLHARDAPTHGFKLFDTTHLRDAATFAPRLPDTLHNRDAYSLTSTRIYPETLHNRDAGSYTLTNLVVGRSGTPDTDQTSDGWVDQASTGTNHGNESLQAKGASSVPGSDQKIGFLQVDLTRLTGQQAGATGGSLTFMASTSNGLTATALTVGFAAQVSRWFTESTMTYATGRPTPSTTVLTGPSVATGAAASYTVTFTQAQLNVMLGKWVIFQFTTAGGALPDTVTILSRDNATASNRPKFTAALIIP